MSAGVFSARDSCRHAHQPGQVVRAYSVIPAKGPLGPGASNLGPGRHRGGAPPMLSKGAITHNSMGSAGSTGAAGQRVQEPGRLHRTRSQVAPSGRRALVEGTPTRGPRPVARGSQVLGGAIKGGGRSDASRTAVLHRCAAHRGRLGATVCFAMKGATFVRGAVCPTSNDCVLRKAMITALGRTQGTGAGRNGARGRRPRGRPAGGRVGRGARALGRNWRLARLRPRRNCSMIKRGRRPAPSAPAGPPASPEVVHSNGGAERFERWA